MRKLLAAALLCASPAFAGPDRVAKQGNDWVRFMDKPCPYASVIRFIPDGERAEYQKADAHFQGQRYFACWRDVGGQVHLWYEDGDQGLIPERDIKEEMGA